MAHKTIELVYPITIEGVETKVIQMRRATYGDIVAASKYSEDEQRMHLACNLMMISPDDFKKMDAADANHILEGMDSLFRRDK
jgi:hypothetical protein